MNTVAKALATALGAGYSPIAPGTCGTAVTVPLAWALSSLPMWQFALVAVAITFLGIAAAHRADLAWGSHDNQKIVVDEVAGYLVTMIPTIPIASGEWAPFAVGFVVFRFFDIVKPPPVRWLDQNLPGGWGVVLDDIAAGIMGAVVMGLLLHFGAFAALARL